MISKQTQTPKWNIEDNAECEETIQQRDRDSEEKLSINAGNEK